MELGSIANLGSARAQRSLGHRPPEGGSVVGRACRPGPQRGVWVCLLHSPDDSFGVAARCKVAATRRAGSRQAVLSRYFAPGVAAYQIIRTLQFMPASAAN